MKKHLTVAFLLYIGTVSAQPAYFTSVSVRDDVAKRVGGYEISCSEVETVIGEDAPYSNCMYVDGGGKYIKSMIDIYYSDYMSGGWKFSGDNVIYNFISKDGQSLELRVIELGKFTILSVYDLNIRTRINEFQAQEKSTQQANKAGFTPDAGYIAVGDLRPNAAIKSGKGSYTVSLNNNILIFRLGSRDVTLNGVSAKLNATPVFMNNVTYFPLGSIKAFGCVFDKPIKESVGISCGTAYMTAAYVSYSTKNPPATTAQLSVAALVKSATQTGASATGVSAQAGQPQSAVPTGAMPNVTYIPLSILEPLGTLSNMANGSFEMMIGGKSLTFQPDTRKTREGISLEAPPFYLKAGMLMIPLSSVGNLECKVSKPSTKDYTIDCPGNKSAKGIWSRW